MMAVSRRLFPSVALSMLTALSIASTANAAGWAPEAGLTPAGTNGQLPSIGLDAAGAATVGWYQQAGGGAVSEARHLAPDGTPAAAQQTSASGGYAIQTGTAVSANGTVTQVWTDGTFTPPTIIHARQIAADGTLGPILTLSDPGQSAVDPVVASAADGSAVVTWRRSDGTHDIAQARRIAPDGTLDPVHDLSAPGQDAGQPTIAVDPDSGRATVVWGYWDAVNASPIIQARRIDAAGTLGPILVVSPIGGNPQSPAVAIDPDGTSTVAWERSDGANVRIQAAQIASDDTVSSAADLSDPGQDAGHPTVAAGPDGAVIAWTRSDGTNPIVQARRIDVSGSLGPVADLSAAGQDARHPDVAIGDDGTTHVVWDRSNGTHAVLQERDLSTADVPGTTHDLSDGTQDAENAQVAVGGDGVAATWDEIVGFADAVKSSIYDATPPAVTATLDATVQQGTALALSAVAIDPAGIGAIAWDFGDGSAGGAGASVSHTYAAVGTYPVTVTATDSVGNATVVHGTVTVTAPPAPAPAPTPATPTPPVAPPAPTPPTPTTPTPPAAPAPASVTITTNPTTVVGSGQLEVGCTADQGTLTSCTVTLTIKDRSGHTVVIGTGHVTPGTASRNVPVVVTLTPRGRKLIDQLGGAAITVTATSTTSTGRKLKSVKTAHVLPPNAVDVPTDGLFASDSAVLDARGKRFVRSAAADLAHAKTITCIGYTDSLGSETYNKSLGLVRAKAICAQLRHEGVKGKLTASSGGESHPRSTNHTAAGRARNRRVELRISYR
jgi:outer membrane protein OmpA-like peptidoglycan-associated protein/PKD repeat protein